MIRNKFYIIAFLAFLSFITPGLPLLAEGYTPYLVQIDDSSLDRLQQEGVLVWGRRADMALLVVPNDSPEALRALKRKGVKRLERGRDILPTMDVARTRFGADNIHSGDAFNSPYTGHGVVVGFCDLGFDPLHPNFIDADGIPRVKRFVSINEFDGTMDILESKEDFADYRTDDVNNTHATHVCGIMAGGAEPFRGAAPDAEIVATTSQLNEVGILAGLEQIIDYASAQGKRAVVNMSLARQSGPHDGSSLFCRWIDLASEDAVIVISSGNSGKIPVSMRSVFSEANPNAIVKLHCIDWMSFNYTSGADLWSDDDRPVRMRMLVIDDTDYSILYRGPWLSSTDNPEWYINLDDTPELKQYFSELEAVIYGGLEPLNNRSNLTFEHQLKTEIVSPKGNWARYLVGLEFDAEPGVSTMLYGAGRTMIRKIKNSHTPDASQSLNDFCTARNVVSVGSYVNRASIPMLDGTTKEFNASPSEVSLFSSYATLPDGRTLPHTVGPGENVISSISSHYIAEGESRLAAANVKQNIDDKDWYWGNMSGTSMSSPYVAGFIATMLQANPKLSSSDIQDILLKTNSREYDNADDARNANGWFNPVMAVRESINRSASVGVDRYDNSSVRLEVSNGILYVYNPDGVITPVTICDTKGNVYIHESVKDAITTLSLPSFPGIYICRAGNRSVKFARTE